MLYQRKNIDPKFHQSDFLMGHFFVAFGGHCRGIEKRVKIGKKKEKIEKVENVLLIAQQEKVTFFLTQQKIKLSGLVKLFVFCPTVTCLEQGQKKRFSAGLACRQERENLALPKIYLPCFLPSSSTHIAHVVTSLALLSLFCTLQLLKAALRVQKQSAEENLGAAVLLLHCETIPFCIWFSSLKKS